MQHLSLKLKIHRPIFERIFQANFCYQQVLNGGSGLVFTSYLFSRLIVSGKFFFQIHDEQAAEVKQRRCNLKNCGTAPISLIKICAQRCIAEAYREKFRVMCLKVETSKPMKHLRCPHFLTGGNRFVLKFPALYRRQ